MAQRVQGFVAPLADFGRKDVNRAGGKGAHLGELVRAGFPVPAGFVVTAAAYEAQLRRIGLTNEPDRATVRAAMRTTELSPGLVDALVRAYRELGGGPVAVRSSATAEDLPQAAFAGLHDTYLNVAGDEAVVEAVRDCWASLDNERAIAYRDRQGIAGASMAVVVQRMVPAESAGVLFTANPVTGARNEIMVDATTGLGETVVAGTVTPDHVVLDKRSGRVTRREPGERTGTLDDHALRRLARLATAVEHHFDAPQDIEWAWAGDRPYLLQTRAITALPAPRPTTRFARAVAGLIAEVLPVRPYPLDVTTWLAALSDVAADVSRRLGLRVSMLDGFLVVRDGVAVRLNPPTIRPTWRVLLLPARLLRRTRIGKHPSADDDAVMDEIEAQVRMLQARDPSTASWFELLTTLRLACALPAGAIELRLRHLPDAVSLLWLWLALVVLGRVDRLGALVSGTDNKTAETNRALDTLAARIRADAGLIELFATNYPAPPRVDPARLFDVLAQRSPAFLDDLRDFLDRYGHRETASPALATQPTWHDAPEVVLGLLRARAATAPPLPARPAWRVARDDVLSHPLLRLPPLRRAFLRWLMRSRRAFRARENSRFYLTRPLPTVRATMLELGHRLQAIRVLDEPEAVFHLTLGELERVVSWPPPPALAGELRASVARRAAKRAALANTPLIDPSWYTPSRQRAEARGALVSGTPGSPGVASGPARIVAEVADFDRLRAGEVLVTPYTNPAWTPLFVRAAAVVVDTGGAASHAAIVAREFGIPAVMATGDATRRLADGQHVQVDGTHGLVLPA
jgi:pyruvate,water dikinase